MNNTTKFDRIIERAASCRNTTAQVLLLIIGAIPYLLGLVVACVCAAYADGKRVGEE